MRDHTLYGYALIGGAALLILMALTHPSGPQLLASRQAFAHVVTMNYAAHTLAIAGAWLCVVGLAGFSRVLGATRPAVTAAFLAFGISAAGIVVAATLDGFVVPQLADRWFDAAEPGQALLGQLMRFCVMVASALTRVFMVLSAAAVLLWSFAARRARISRGLPWLGVLVAVAAVAVTVGGPAFVSVHELLALVLAQSAWLTFAGVILVRGPIPPAGPETAAAGPHAPPEEDHRAGRS